MPSWYSLPIIKTKEGIIKDFNTDGFDDSTDQTDRVNVGNLSVDGMKPTGSFILDISGNLKNDTLNETSTFIIDVEDDAVPANVFNTYTFNKQQLVLGVEYPFRKHLFRTGAVLGLTQPTNIRVNFYLNTSTITTTNASIINAETRIILIDG